MTLFEYLAIAFSLLFTLAAIRIAAGIPHAIAAKKRYWPHVLLIVHLLYFIIALFWNFWSFRDVAWTQYYFILALCIPTLIYASVAMAIPDNPSRISSWRDYYFGIRKSVYATLLIWALMAMIVNMVILGQAWNHPSRFFQLAFAVVHSILMTSDESRTHTILLLMLLAINLFGLITYGYRPDWLLS